MKNFFENFLKGHLVWLFGAIFIAFILCFITKDMPNETAAGWFVTMFGTIGAGILQAWHHKEFKTDKYDWFNVGIAAIIFIFAGLIRTFAEL